MKFAMFSVVAVALSALSAPSMAAAVPQNQKIAVNMTLTQMGVPLKGSFQHAQVSGVIPDQGAGNVIVTLMTNSLGGVTQDAIDAGKSASWLNTQKYPTATFKSTSLNVNGGKGSAQGQLTIKGITKPAIASFTVQNGKVQGQLTFDRTQFQLGTEEWASTTVIAAPVKIDFSF